MKFKLVTGIIIFWGAVFSFSYNLFSREKFNLKVSAAGDIFISNRILKKYSKIQKSDEKVYLTGNIVFANFEGILSEKPSENERLRYILSMPLMATNKLKEMGFNFLSLSNNHCMDKGKESYNFTRNFLSEAGFSIAGYNDSGTSFKINGKSIRIIGFTFSGTNNVNDINGAVRLIKSFHEDIIIVSAHMGDEGPGKEYLEGRDEFFEKTARGNVLKFSHAVIDAGADLVIGHGPHYLRTIEIYKHRAILYSLGNFIFDYPGVDDYGPFPTAVVEVNLDGNGKIVSGKIQSYFLKKGIPFLDKTGYAQRMIEKDMKRNIKEFNALFYRQ